MMASFGHNLNEERTNPVSLVARVNQVYTLAPNIFSLVAAVFPSQTKIGWCTEQKAPDKTYLHKSLQNCQSSVWNSLHVTFWLEEFGGCVYIIWKSLYACPKGIDSVTAGDGYWH